MPPDSYDVALIKKRCRQLGKVKKHRIDELKVAAIYAGRFVGNPGIDRQFCINELRDACTSNGTATYESEALISKTIDDGLAEGAKQKHVNGNGQAVKSANKIPVVWREKRGAGPVASFHNAKSGILAMGVTIHHDTFHDATIIGRKGDVVTHDVRPLMGELSDPVLLRLRDLFSNTYGFDVGDNYIYSAVKALAFENCFDPVLDMIDEAKGAWDKIQRLDRMAPDYLNTDDTELNRVVMRKHMIAAVRRVRQPGCQYQIMVVLESDEGWNKSAAIRTIAGEENFSDENILGARGKEAMELLRTIWHHECAELTDIRKADVEHVKAFISRQWDMHRPAYGRMLIKQPRQSVEWGTTNDSEYLTSQTGNRRFAPMRVLKPIDIEKLARDRLQLIGEAAHYETQGESLVIPESLWPLARVEQEKRRIRDPWEDILADLPDSIVGSDAARHTIIHRTIDNCEQIATADVITHVLKIPIAQQTGAMGRKVASAMLRNGWQRHESGLLKINGKNARGYWRYGVSTPATDAATDGFKNVSKINDATDSNG